MVAAGADVLVRTNRRGTWAWAGLRLRPVDPAAPVERLADAETAWLAGQWTASGPARFEVRYRTRPGTGLLDCALLCRVQVATSSAAVRAAHADRDSLAAALPAHVAAEPIPDRALVRDWLTPFAQPAIGGQWEVVKDLAWRETRARGRRRGLALLVAPFSSVRESWEPVLRTMAALPFGAVLSVGFAPFNPTPAFRLRVAELAREYDVAAQTAEGGRGPVGPGTAEFAARAAASFQAYGDRYTAAAFQARISLAGERALPDSLGWDLAALLSGPQSSAERAVALRPVERDRAAAWNNLATLGADWLPDTYRRGVPDREFGAAERTLMTLIDVAEARSVLRLPWAVGAGEPLFEPAPPPGGPAAR